MAVNDTGVQLAQGNLAGAAASLLPKIAGAAQTGLNVIVWAVIVIVMFVGITTFLIIWLQKRRYRNTLIIFERINGVWVDTRLDKGMELNFGDMGGKVMYFKRMKRYESFPSIQSGERKFYFKLHPNGILENFKLVDEQSNDSKIDEEMSKAALFHHTGINRGLDKRYDKFNLAAYIPMFVGLGAIIIICVFVWLIMDKWISLAAATTEGVKNSALVMDQANRILSNMQNICQGGKGFITSGG